MRPWETTPMEYQLSRMAAPQINDTANSNGELWFRYVRHEDITKFQANCWRVVTGDLGRHGAYAVLMKWEGNGEPS